MIFGEVLLKDALGSVLAHSVRVGGLRLRKGQTLGAADIAQLSQAGITHITVARPETGDIDENTAAARIATALVPATNRHITQAAPFTGRANLFAECGGVLRVDSGRIAALNSVDEAITLATLPDYARVQARQLVGTVKIIPYMATQRAVQDCQALLAGDPAIWVQPVVRRQPRLILTRTPGMNAKLLAKGTAAIRLRLETLGLHLPDPVVTDHDTNALKEALGQVDGDMILVLTGSATSDRADVGPAALIGAGGMLARFGMPVDPGNLLFLGTLGERPVIGLPGCARSPKLNGADWVIERIACGIDVDAADIAAMGVGGLLKEIPSRPEPRSGGGRVPVRPQVMGVLLAAGSSRRMGERDKLLEEVHGQPMIRHAAQTLLTSGIDGLTVVLRPQAEPLRAALAGLDLRMIENPHAAQGMGTSIATAIRALPDRADAVLIGLADMPDMTSAGVDRLLAAFDPGEGRAIVRATAPDGRPGHPVIFGRRFFEVLSTLEGDTGARAIIQDHADFLVDVALADAGAVTDLDTPQDWQAWREKHAKG